MAVRKDSSLEKLVKSDIKKELVAHNAWYFMPVPTGLGAMGVPDVIACVPTVITEDMVGNKVGLFFAVEAKRFGGVPTKIQEHQIARIREAGGIALVVDGTKKESGSFGKFVGLLKTLVRKKK